MKTYINYFFKEKLLKLVNFLKLKNRFKLIVFKWSYKSSFCFFCSSFAKFLNILLSKKINFVYDLYFVFDTNNILKFLLYEGPSVWKGF